MMMMAVVMVLMEGSLVVNLMKISINNKILPFLLLCIFITGCVGTIDKNVSNFKKRQTIVKTNQQSNIPIKKIIQCQSYTGNDWINAYQSCPNNALIAANAIRQYLNQGQYVDAKNLVVNINDKLKNNNDIMYLSKMINQPFQLATEIADKAVKSWLIRPSDITLINAPAPVLAKYPDTPILVKNQFESRREFYQRVELAKKQREAQMINIHQQYDIAVKNYNDKIIAYNQAIKNERQQRQTQMNNKRNEFFNQALQQVLGNPILQDWQYDAEQKIFNAKLTSSFGNFNRNVALDVPSDIAKLWYDNNYQFNQLPKVRFSLVEGRVNFDHLSVAWQGREYQGVIGSSNIMNDNINVDLANYSNIGNNNEIALLNIDSKLADMIDDNNAQFDNINFDDDPEIQRQRQALQELKRKKQAREKFKARQKQLALIEEEKRKLQQDLAATGDYDYKGLQIITQWEFKPARQVNDNLFAVVIGNRDYDEGIPKVHFARNDALAVHQYVKETLRLPAENIIYLENATKQQMQTTFTKRLPSLMQARPGAKQVMVYFSGHGIPDSSGKDALLLASDASFFDLQGGGYSREQLLTQLAALDSEQIHLFLDACFTGQGKNGRAISEGKAFRPSARIRDIPAHISLFSASAADQTAWMDDKTGHSYMTYFMLEGLKGRADSNGDAMIDSNELHQYMHQQIQRKSLQEKPSAQTPEFYGKKHILVSY